MNPVDHLTPFSALIEARQQEIKVADSITLPYYDPEVSRRECDYTQKPKFVENIHSRSFDPGQKVSDNLYLSYRMPECPSGNIAHLRSEQRVGSIFLAATVPIYKQIWTVAYTFNQYVAPNFFPLPSIDRFVLFVAGEGKFHVYELSTGKELFSQVAPPVDPLGIEVRGESLFYIEKSDLDKTTQTYPRPFTATFCQLNLKTGKKIERSFVVEDLTFSSNLDSRQRNAIVSPILYPDDPEKFGLFGLNDQSWCWWTVEHKKCSKISASFLATLTPTCVISDSQLTTIPNTNMRAFSSHGTTGLVITSNNSGHIITDCGQPLTLGLGPCIIDVRRVFPRLYEFPVWFQTMLNVNFINQRYVQRYGFGLYDFFTGDFVKLSDHSYGNWTFSLAGKHLTSAGVLEFPSFASGEKVDSVFNATLGSKSLEERVYSLILDEKDTQAKRLVLSSNAGIDKLFLGVIRELFDDNEVVSLRERGALFNYEEFVQACDNILNNLSCSEKERRQLKRFRSGLSHLLEMLEGDKVQRRGLSGFLVERISSELALRHPSTLHSEYGRYLPQVQQKKMDRWRDRELTKGEIDEIDSKALAWLIRGWRTDLGPTLNAELTRLRNLHLYDEYKNGNLPDELQQIVEHDDKPMLKFFMDNYRKLATELREFCVETIDKTRKDNPNYNYDQAVHIALEGILENTDIPEPFKHELAELQGGVIASLLDKTSLGIFKSQVAADFPKRFIESYHNGVLPEDSKEAFEEKYRGSFLKKKNDEGDPTVYRALLNNSSDADSILGQFDLSSLFPEIRVMLKRIHNVLYGPVTIEE